jgi:hypothetical protein
VPTVRDSAPPSKPAICDFKMLMISSDLIAMVLCSSLLYALRRFSRLP